MRTEDAGPSGSVLSAGLGLVERLRFLASGQDDPHSVALTEAADEIERLRVTLHHVECGLRAAEEDRDELLARLSALVNRCAYDGVPNDSLPVWQAAHDAVMSRKTPTVALAGQLDS